MIRREEKGSMGKIRNTLGSSNEKQRMAFVEYWAEYVRTQDDWSVHQARLINALLESGKSMTKEQYLEMKRVVIPTIQE